RRAAPRNFSPPPRMRASRSRARCNGTATAGCGSPMTSARASRRFTPSGRPNSRAPEGRGTTMTNAKAGLLGVLIVLLTMVASGIAGAENYPARPIQVIVPFAGGSASDVVTRILLDRAAKSIGEPFIVDNRPGAGGNTGTLAAVRATPDGYTIVGSGTGPIAANKTLYRDLGYDPEKDLEPVSMIGVFPIVVTASA